MSQPSNIRNILFDLGGVILDIDVNATKQRFYELGLPAMFLQYPENMVTDIFFKYETGRLDTDGFRNEVRRLSGLEISDDEINQAWIAMLVGIPGERGALLDRLKERYSLYMLSNTSAMHVPVFEQMYLDTAGVTLQSVFKRIYYSFEIGYHKPEIEAWEYVIKDSGIEPAETLFLDDNIHNIKTSQELGFKAIHIHERTSLTDLGFDL